MKIANTHWQRWLVVGILLLAIAALIPPDWWAAIWRPFSVESISALAAYLRSFGLWTPLVSTLLMILQAVIAPLPGSLVAAANGILFGVWWGTLLSWVGGMAGAAVSFWLARGLRRTLVSRWIAPEQLRMVDQLSLEHGFWVVLMARLTPIISLDAIGYLAGLSQMRFGSYMLANAIGIAPGMAAYTILGHDLALAQTVTWRASLILLGGFIAFLAGRWWLRRH